MKKFKIIIALFVICSIIAVTAIGLCDENTITVKRASCDYISDGTRPFYFTSQSGEELPMLEYKDSVYVPVRSFCRYIGKEVDWTDCGGDCEITILPLPKNKYEGLVYGNEEDIYEYPLVSMIELIARPDEYDGKNITVSGVINIAYESDFLFLTQEDYIYAVLENSVALNWMYNELNLSVETIYSQEFYDVMGDLSGVHVEIAGKFKKSKVSGDGIGSRGYLTDIKCMRCHEIMVD